MGKDRLIIKNSQKEGDSNKISYNKIDQKDISERIIAKRNVGVQRQIGYDVEVILDSGEIPSFRQNTLVYGDGVFLNFDTSTCYRTVFGYKWQGFPLPISSSNWRLSEFGNGIFVLVGSISQTDRFLFSNDYGKTFGVVSSSLFHIWRGSTYAKGKFVLIGNTAGSGIGSINYSSDGENWNLVTVDNFVWDDVIFAENKFIGFSFSDRTLMFSEDGISWGDYKTFPSLGTAIHSVAYHNDAIFFGTSTGLFMTKDLCDTFEFIPAGGTRIDKLVSCEGILFMFSSLGGTNDPRMRFYDSVKGVVNSFNSTEMPAVVTFDLKYGNGLILGFSRAGGGIGNKYIIRSGKIVNPEIHRLKN